MFVFLSSFYDFGQILLTSKNRCAKINFLMVDPNFSNWVIFNKKVSITNYPKNLKIQRALKSFVFFSSKFKNFQKNK